MLWSGQIPSETAISRQWSTGLFSTASSNSLYLIHASADKTFCIESVSRQLCLSANFQSLRVYLQQSQLLLIDNQNLSIRSTCCTNIQIAMSFMMLSLYATIFRSKLSHAIERGGTRQRKDNEQDEQRRRSSCNTKTHKHKHKQTFRSKSAENWFYVHTKSCCSLRASANVAWDHFSMDSVPPQFSVADVPCRIFT